MRERRSRITLALHPGYELVESLWNDGVTLVPGSGSFHTPFLERSRLISAFGK
jgi:hypothetical protein